MHTKLVRNLYNVSTALQGAVVTIGNFDGVHLGHQELIATVVEKARQENCPSALITFEPHPFEYFQREKIKVPRLTRLREKFLQLSKLGLDHVIVLTFNQALAELSAREFVEKVLVHALQTKHLIIGDDFHFGYQRQGDIKLLQEMGNRYHFTVKPMPTVLFQGERISSTRVRKALGEDNLPLTEKLIGRPYSMLGRVGTGDRLGRVLGFPTANIFLHRCLTPVHGVYIVYVHGLTEDPLPGVANVGSRPAVNGQGVLLEVHLLNFNKNIYGAYVEVEFCQKLREEEYYPTLDLLKTQIAKDVDCAYDYFRKQGVL